MRSREQFETVGWLADVIRHGAMLQRIIVSAHTPERALPDHLMAPGEP